MTNKMTATGLSVLLEGKVSYDQVQRFLANSQRTSTDARRIAKPQAHKIERKDAVTIVDDSMIARPGTDENDIICRHYDHAKEQLIKGINFMTELFHSVERQG